jgi:hypothetical protein
MKKSSVAKFERPMKRGRFVDRVGADKIYGSVASLFNGLPGHHSMGHATLVAVSHDVLVTNSNQEKSE